MRKGNGASVREGRGIRKKKEKKEIMKTCKIFKYSTNESLTIAKLS